MAFMAWSQGSRQIHYCLSGHPGEPARLAAIPIAYYVKGCADVPLGHRLQPPRDLAWVFQRNLGRLCVHCPNHGASGSNPHERKTRSPMILGEFPVVQDHSGSCVLSPRGRRPHVATHAESPFRGGLALSRSATMAIWPTPPLK